MKTKAINITKTVFENQSETMLYIVHDLHADTFVVAIPTETFSFQIWSEKDIEVLKMADQFTESQRIKLIEVVREEIQNWD